MILGGSKVTTNVASPHGAFQGQLRPCASLSIIHAIAAFAASCGQGSVDAVALAAARRLDSADPQRADLVAFALAQRSGGV